MRRIVIVVLCLMSLAYAVSGQDMIPSETRGFLTALGSEVTNAKNSYEAMATTAANTRLRLLGCVSNANYKKAVETATAVADAALAADPKTGGIPAASTIGLMAVAGNGQTDMATATGLAAEVTNVLEIVAWIQTKGVGGAAALDALSKAFKDIPDADHQAARKALGLTQ